MKKKIERLITACREIKRPLVIAIGLGVAAFLGLIFWYSKSGGTTESAKAGAPSAARVGNDEIQLTGDQLPELKVGPAEIQKFELKRDAIGIIDFNQDRSVPMFSPYQGRIGTMLVRAGEDVTRGQVLYTVQIPDIASAASSLISTNGTLKVATQTLQRAQALYETQSISLKELQQNTADHQAADAAYRAARKTLTLFGLTNKEIEDIEAQRKVDTEMQVRSPFAGRVTARAGAVGQLVQPGSGTPPLVVADLQTLWMVANVPEAELAGYSLGQAVSVKVAAYPEMSFSGKINYISDSADAATHRIIVRAEVPNGKRLLKPQMLANFNITLGAPVNSVAVPANAIAREGDGSISVWVTQEGTRFKRRKVQVGLFQNGLVQVIDGLNPGEKIATDKALFLSNLYLITVN